MATTIIFDLDGTLVDSAPDMHAAANRMLQALEQPGRPARSPLSLDQARGFIGDGVAAFVKRALGAANLSPDAEEVVAITARFLADYQANAATLTRPYPGAEAVLAAFQGAGYRLALCTNKPQKATEALLSALGLRDYFEVVGAGDRYGAMKPDAAHLLGVLAEMGVAPGDAVMVGDDGNDSAAAAGAGVRFVLAAWGYARTSTDDIPATARVRKAADLLTLDL